MFLKHWYSISETINLLNNYFKINALPNTITDFFGDMGSIQFTEKDILNFYNDEYLRFSIRVKKIDNSIPIIDFFNHRIEMNSYLYDSFDDKKIAGIYSISTDDSVIYSDNDGYLYAKGLFKLPIDFTEITKDKFIVSSIKIYDDEELDVECENGNVNYIYNIAFPFPIEIEKDLVLISRKEIINLISMIKQENQYANEAIIHNTSYQKENDSIIKKQSNQIAELQARIAELEAEKQNPKKPEPKEDVQEYGGDIPPQTDRDKLAKTFRLVIQQSKFIEMNNGRYPTYSQLHTMLNHIYPKEQIPSKNTLKKYLEP